MIITEDVNLRHSKRAQASDKWFYNNMVVGHYPDSTSRVEDCMTYIYKFISRHTVAFEVPSERNTKVIREASEMYGVKIELILDIMNASENYKEALIK